MWSWYKVKHIDQWNRIESTVIKHYVYGQLIFYKGTKKIPLEE